MTCTLTKLSAAPWAHLFYLLEHENWRQQRFASQKEAQFCRSPKTCRKPFVVHVPLSDLAYLHVYLGMLYFALNWCFILEIQTATIKWKQYFEESDLTQLHLEAYHRLTFPTHQMEVRGTSGDLHREFNSKKFCISFTLLTERRPKQDTCSPVIIMEN